MTPLSFRPLRRALRCAGALLVLFAAVSAQSGPPKLSQSETEQLARDKLIIGKQDYPQIFTPYIELAEEPGSIRFVTSDAMLAAYHALFEDSFRELELRRAAYLREDLEQLYKDAIEEAAKRSCSDKQIQLILGPALVILDSQTAPKTFSPELLSEIERQVVLIRTAEQVERPPWLVHSEQLDRLIDYRRCRPVGFYEHNPALAEYFRAMRWLQIVPLCADDDEELLTWSLMVQSAAPNRSFDGLTRFVGPLSGASLAMKNRSIRSACSQIGWGYDSEKEYRKILRHRLTETFLQEHVLLHIMPEHSLPDAELLTECLNEEVLIEPLKNEALPEGLTVAAFLGSEFAHAHMPALRNPGNWADRCRRANLLMFSQDGESRSLYADYIDLLRTLNLPPVKGAPAFMNSQPWQIKSCQTQLAGWAQMRHTYVLQAKQSIVVGGMLPFDHPGFVEPNPAFWREFVRLVERTMSLLNEEKVFDLSATVFADGMRRLADDLSVSFETHRKERSTLSVEQTVERPELDVYLLTDPDNMIEMDTSGRYRFYHHDYKSGKGVEENYQDAINWLRDGADKVERGEMRFYFPSNQKSLVERWKTLIKLSRQLEAILAKQLDHIDLSDLEKGNIISFGETLAESMGYFAGAIEGPNDDVPRWVNIAHVMKHDLSFGTGIGRPRTIHVLYPWNGQELLCTGAVNTYYESWEFPQQLTDGEWKQKLDAALPPDQPDWLQPILAK